MLIRISLFIAIILGIGATVLNVVKVKDKITTLQTNLKTETEAHQKFETQYNQTKSDLDKTNAVLKQTQEARVFRRAQAVREVVAGHHVNTVSATFHVANSALRKWVQRFAQEGPQGLLDRPRSGRPPKVTCELEQHLNRLVDQDPLQHGALSSQWSCRELATVLARETGVQLGRESVRCVLKKTR